MSNERVYQMNLAKVYGLLVAKAERKGRTRAEVDEVTRWLTGYSQEQLDTLLADPSATYGAFFEQAPAPNPDRELVTGVVCGVRVEEVEEPLMREIRRLDKLVDELAKGRSMEKVLRRR
ncbi:MAG: DUF2200 domain-containing protein [Coriobacteriia bacterium]|nr:DUF2200 domain-containing protein [Coriobacteriia bacterium]MBS5477438.1 DUF2200 domain-containing protein [Coriobacteriia bacterium]